MPQPIDYAAPTPSGLSKSTTRLWITASILLIFLAVLLPKFLGAPAPRVAPPPPTTGTPPPGTVAPNAAR